MTAILAVHMAATWGMVGLIWFVQVVHYPSFDRVERSGAADFQRFHMRRTTWVVAPLMLIEAAAAILVVLRPAETASPLLGWVGLALLAVAWLSTWRLQVPCHEALLREFDAGIHRALVASNWIRTAAWTLRGVVAIALVGIAA
jgi:hypothetical protein